MLAQGTHDEGTHHALAPKRAQKALEIFFIAFELSTVLCSPYSSKAIYKNISRFFWALFGARA
jgi:hypothetical protein